MRIRMGTRGSKLARAQSTYVGRMLEHAGHEIGTLVIKTAGDRQTDRAFQDVGAPGIFVREIEKALLEDRIDLAVHSFKDLPSDGPEGLVIAAIPERVDARDLLITREREATGSGLLPLPEGAIVGTASARRTALLASLRPDLKVALLRGNVETRLRRLREGAFDAILLAAAGVRRLARQANHEPFDLSGLTVISLDAARFVPAPAQGALALQVRAADEPVREVVAALDDAEVRREITAERALLARVEGGCSLPFGAFCHGWEGGELEMVAALGTDDGLIRVRGRHADPLALAEDLWNQIHAAVERRP